jgi:hypothetical protein
LNEKQRVVVRLGDSILAETARTAAGVKLAVSLPELAAPAFVAGLLGDRVLSMFLVGGRMLAVVEIVIDSADDTIFLNHSLRSVAIDYRMIPIAVTSEGKAPTFDWSHRLREGERFIVITTVADLERITRRAPVSANCSIEILSYPLSAFQTLFLQTRVCRNLSAEAAEQIVAAPPFLLAEAQTRGQAEELLGLLQREKVSARVLQR